MKMHEQAATQKKRPALNNKGKPLLLRNEIGKAPCCGILAGNISVRDTIRHGIGAQTVRTVDPADTFSGSVKPWYHVSPNVLNLGLRRNLQTTHGVVNRRPLRNCIIGTIFDLHHDTLVNDLAEIGIIAVRNIAVMRLDGLDQIRRRHIDVLVLIGMAVDDGCKLFKAIGFEDSSASIPPSSCDADINAPLLGDLFAKDTKSRKTSGILGRL